MGVLGVPWLYPTEINALEMRTKGASLAMASNWIMNYMVVQVRIPARLFATSLLQVFIRSEFDANDLLQGMCLFQPSLRGDYSFAACIIM